MKLLPCMHCDFDMRGPDPAACVEKGFDTKKRPVQFVLCPNCGARGPDWLCEFMGPAQSVKEAIDAWNSRAVTPLRTAPLVDIVEEIRRRTECSQVVCVLKPEFSGRASGTRIFTSALPKKELAMLGVIALGQADAIEGVRESLKGCDTLYIEDVLGGKKPDVQGGGKVDEH